MELTPCKGRGGTCKNNGQFDGLCWFCHTHKPCLNGAGTTRSTACMADAPRVTTATKTVEVLELFTFVDGVRLAWVTWLLCDGERRAISVRELAR